MTAVLSGGRDMNKNKVIIEARINEYNMRDVNSNVPWTVDEIVEEAQRVREAGASILHFHARTNDGGAANDPEVYGEIIRRIREKTDILILPTLGFDSNDKDADRIQIIKELSKSQATKPDIIPLDTGTVNLEQYDAEKKCFADANAIYSNPTDILEYCAAEMLKCHIKVKMTCWDMGFVRRGSKLIEMGKITKPGYFLFHLTEGRFITGHPCTKAGIDALRSVLPEEECYWSVNCKGGNLLTMAPYILEQGGNIAIGIGDYDYSELGAPKNAQLVGQIVEMAKNCGREPATPAEVKKILNI